MTIDREILASLRTSGPEFFQRMVGIFLDQTPPKLETMVQALLDEDLELLALTVHPLIGNSGMLGAQLLSQHCHRLEVLARDGARAACADQLRRVEREYESAAGELRTLIEEERAGRPEAGVERTTPMSQAPRDEVDTGRWRVALATGADWPDLIEGDRILVDHLERCGFEVRMAIWEDPAVDWRSFDAIVIRTCWDYHRKLEAFHGWLDRLDGLGCVVWNPSHLLRWNSRKNYLEELGARGVEIVPTAFLDAGQAPGASLADWMDRWAVDELVIKPTVAASAFGVWRIARQELGEPAARQAAEDRWRRDLAAQDLMIQPLVREVLVDGEWSLIYFGDRLSHAILKRPGAGDFRVQEELGGVSVPGTAPASVVAAAERTLEALGEEILYARVDLVEIDGRGVLMELELIEPWIYFELAPESPERFRQALEAKLRAGR